MSIIEETIDGQVKLTQDDYWSARRKAIKYNHEKNYKEALKYIDIALEINPDALDMISDKGTILYKLGDYSSAKTWLKKYLDSNSNNIFIIHKYLKCLFRLGEVLNETDKQFLLCLIDQEDIYESEIKQLESFTDDEIVKKATANIRSKKAPSIAEAITNMSCLEALQYIETHVQDSKKKNKIYCEFLYNKELFEELYSYLEREIEDSPNNPNNYLLMSKYRKIIGEYSQAIDILKKYNEVNIKQGYVFTNEELARLYIMNGNIDEAMKIINSLESYLKTKEEKGEIFGYYKFKSLSSFYRMLGDEEKCEYYERKYEKYKDIFKR